MVVATKGGSRSIQNTHTHGPLGGDRLVSVGGFALPQLDFYVGLIREGQNDKVRDEEIGPLFTGGQSAGVGDERNFVKS